jgi:hypothetical protein
VKALSQPPRSPFLSKLPQECMQSDIIVGCFWHLLEMLMLWHPHVRWDSGCIQVTDWDGNLSPYCWQKVVDDAPTSQTSIV